MSEVNNEVNNEVAGTEPTAEETIANLQAQIDALKNKNKEIIGEKRAVQEKVKRYGEATPEEIEALRSALAGKEAEELKLKGSYAEAQKLIQAEAERKLEHERQLAKAAIEEAESIKKELKSIKLDGAVKALLAESGAIKPDQAYKLIKEDLLLVDNKPSVKVGDVVIPVEEYISQLKTSDANLFKAPDTSGYGTKAARGSRLNAPDAEYQLMLDKANAELSAR